GMSTTLEAIVAHHAGLPVFAVSIITDLGIEGKIENVSMETVLHEAGKAEALMTPIIVEMIGSL
ncbi:MAG: purine-nucleoside phosphorylase, partial [Bacteroidales bacterium]|nr:purine-nucleoside phosphorylase [Bacteroidales bacterium]